MVSERFKRSFAAVVVDGVDNFDESASGNPISNRRSAPDDNSPRRAQRPRRSSDGYNDPLFLHNNDTASLMLVSAPLTGPNYRTWSRVMKLVLRVWNKWGIVSKGVLTPGIDHPDYEAWDRCDVMVSSWIIRAVIETIAESVMYIDTT